MYLKKISCLILLLAASAQAEPVREYHFFNLHLPAPPEKGTAAYDADFIRLHELQDHRTPEQCAAADAQSFLTLENGFGPATGVLTDAEVKEAKRLSARVLARAGLAVYYFKQKFKRARPFNTDPSLTPCIHKPSANDLAYPSGHSTVGYALALALAKKFPEKKAMILAQGLKIGENRLIGGVHHPSDVEAGRKLAVQLVKNLNRSF